MNNLFDKNRAAANPVHGQYLVIEKAETVLDEKFRKLAKDINDKMKVLKNKNKHQRKIVRISFKRELKRKTWVVKDEAIDEAVPS